MNGAWQETPDSHLACLDHPVVGLYVSLRAFGTTSGRLEAVAGEIRTRTSPGARVVSPCCGSAVAELELAEALPDRRFVAADPRPAFIATARERAAARGIDNIRLLVAAPDEVLGDLEGVDVVTLLGTGHEIADLGGFWRQCRRSLRPGGVVLAQEYVGPPDLAWEGARAEAATRALDALPACHKTHHDRVDAALGARVLAEHQASAPHGQALVSSCQDEFEFAGFARAGGALLHPVLVGQIATFDPNDWEHNRRLAELFQEEARLLEDGTLDDDFVMFVAVPRR